MSQKQTVLTVDRNKNNLALLGQFLVKEGIPTLMASTLEELDTTLENPDLFGLVIIDISGFDGRIWSRCNLISSHNTPFLVISPKQIPEIQQASMAHGAQGFLTKPLVVREFIGLIRNFLEG